MADLAGFTQFIRNYMEIDAITLPDGSQSISDSFAIAIDWVNPLLMQISALQYDRAVYNLAADTLINIGPSSVFSDLRTMYDVNNFNAGVIQSSGDESTNQARTVPEAFKNLTIQDLQNLKTPYGRTYLAIAQQYGDLWGVS